MDALTARQTQCLRLCARGLPSGQIGASIGLSPRTVDEHLTGACRALGVRTRIQAVALLTLSERRRPPSRPPVS